jgi:hypothetical protein
MYSQFSLEDFENVLSTYLEMIFIEGLPKLKNVISPPTEKQPLEFDYAELNAAMSKPAIF